MEFGFFFLALATIAATKGRTQQHQQQPLVPPTRQQVIASSEDLASSCSRACQRLKNNYPSQVIFPSEGVYDTTLSKFWSLQQSETHPACIFRPTTSQDLASLIVLVRETQCPFAVKSGGHVPFAGASNIANAITVDLEQLDEVTIHQERETVSVGSGNRWIDVYKQLEEHQVTVVGGRIADVGVGGLTLGGGISFFSNKHGWACDNVATYEVITAAGEIVNASATEHADLYWALRGGASNFGIVTKFELRSYVHDHQMWVGKVLHPWAARAHLIKSFIDFGKEGDDPHATVLFSFVYMQKQDQYISVSETDYAIAVPDGQHPRVFDGFFSVPDSIQTAKATQTIVEVIQAHSASNPNGLRQSYWTATFLLNQHLAKELVELWKEKIDPIKSQVTGFVPVLTLQVITTTMIQHMQKEGRNALGLDAKDRPLMIFAPSAMWTDRKHDEIVLSTYADWLAIANARAGELHLGHRYLYMNYASQFQDPIRGYGEENEARLRKVAEKWDPEGVLQRLQPGYFKL